MKIVLACLTILSMLSLLYTIVQGAVDPIDLEGIYDSRTSTPVFRFVVIWGSAVGLGFMAFAGSHALLWWIPDDWGWMQEDGYTKARWSLSTILGLFLWMAALGSMEALIRARATQARARRGKPESPP